MNGLIGKIVWNKAEKLERSRSSVAELVNIVRGNIDNVPLADGAFGLPLHHHSVSLKDKDFVFVGMAVKGGVAAGFDLELPHGEVGSSVRIRDQLPHGTALCTFHLDFVFFDRFVTDDFHWDPWFPGKHDRNRVKPDSLKLGELESHCKHSDACMLNFAI